VPGSDLAFLWVHRGNTALYLLKCSSDLNEHFFDRDLEGVLINPCDSTVNREPAIFQIDTIVGIPPRSGRICPQIFLGTTSLEIPAASGDIMKARRFSQGIFFKHIV
jgi:hypothetical protein